MGAWNLLPGLVVEAGIIVPCKRRLEKPMDMQTMEGYESCIG